MKVKREMVVFLAPALLLITVFLFVPIFQSLCMSFYSDSEPKQFVGLANYIEIFSDNAMINLKGLPKPPSYGALVHNFIWILIHLPVSLFLGLTFSLLLDKLPRVSVIRSAVFVGMVIPGVIVGIMVQFLFGKNAGMIPQFFRMIHVDTLHMNWFSHPETALIALILTNIWTWTGYSMIVFTSSLTTIPDSYIEAGRIDGASSFQILKMIKIPLLKPSMRIIIVMSIINELTCFDIVYASTGGGPGGASSVLGVEMYLNAFRYFEFGKGAAVATVLTLLTAVPIAINVRNSVKNI